MNKLVSKCPVCKDNLKIMKLKCTECNTIIENEFKLSAIQQLSDEQLTFVETFLICRGNIKDVEKTLGISYPTVRSKLDEIIDELAIKKNKQSYSKDRNIENILNLIEKGEMTVSDALKKL